MSPQLEVQFVFFGAFSKQLVHLDNDENSAIDNELTSKVKNVSIDKCDASFYTQCLIVTL
jgi:hypothetical protein